MVNPYPSLLAICVFVQMKVSTKFLKFFFLKTHLKHSEYNHWMIGVNMNDGSFWSTATGVNGDDGGVSNGLFDRCGDSGGFDFVRLSIGLSKKSPKLKIFLLVFKFESDVNMGLLMNSIGSSDKRRDDKQLNELDRLLASLEGNWNISSDGDSSRFGDNR